MKIVNILRFALIGAIICCGSATASASPTATKTDTETAKNYYYLPTTLKGYGNIEKAGEIYMSIVLRNGRATGKYYYSKVNKNRKSKSWINVSGSVDQEEFTMTLKENDGIFYGQFLKIEEGFLYYGTFVRNDGRHFDFSIEFY